MRMRIKAVISTRQLAKLGKNYKVAADVLVKDLSIADWLLLMAVLSWRTSGPDKFQFAGPFPSMSTSLRRSDEGRLFIT